MSKRSIPFRARLRRRIHRSLPALLFACLALLGQIGLGAAMPETLAPLLGGDMAMPSAICQDMGEGQDMDEGPDAAPGDSPAGPPSHPHAHREDCALCPGC